MALSPEELQALFAHTLHTGEGEFNTGRAAEAYIVRDSFPRPWWHPLNPKHPELEASMHPGVFAHSLRPSEIVLSWSCSAGSSSIGFLVAGLLNLHVNLHA